MKLSAIVATRNEGKMLGPCLESLGFADEIIVVDMESSDDTLTVARKFNVTIINYPWKRFDYSGPRNKGFEKSQGEWILYIDADERVTPLLRKEIIRSISLPAQAGNSENQYSAYAIPRRNIIFNQEFKHVGQWPDYAKRLFKRGKFQKFEGAVHEEPVFDGVLGHLTNSMIHNKHENISEMIEKTNQWSDIEARLMFEAKHPQMNIFRFASAIVREFWLRMISQRAFLDGTKGMIYALYQAFSRYVSYSKLWELQIKDKK
ncbi:hypothetical protein A3D84_05535 [Candidatus Woesebacteria bacterium RIFCSPHIGHO2_02_FULL_42_20]|uniref:Glycosyltransferase 2-like domain-containing protein n=1 Tax=Candidatus Woesebacteria bacterium RIFCSPHIGHO2_12_FULL_41_24 TaxID=1802510 RepID=A0A1F8ASL5_9BACT|nr:MAG: hypothetical protein A2873_00200 [Candidatus Woesebacteria bacterium RIFCSPHIGHO2_01_FULL_42_80]OGM35505.1 MAG: hypothetical protein A3D84_05535 [Candidatus Woesebacteria bacterium RIFCSPHIGHO2_02_FULL_42_20]OGM54268.1 MAG: hypothetical protein A3E44_01925 [Candidatus Woesebacteria bacterium RIFCSPHIGHO2_12_FULL_41_24]OGM66285.1 MAG: hypothetical protein A2969_01685 [Candidatus Woesebacteria bacterium RIFCSPLOWO2_01_FULL_42_67]